MDRAVAAIESLRALAPDDEFERLLDELEQLAQEFRDREALLQLAIEKARLARKSTR